MKIQGGYLKSKFVSEFDFYKVSKRFHGVASFYSKYLIIGGGYAGMSLAKLMANDPYRIKGEEITMIDVVPDYTVYPWLKYHCIGGRDILKQTKYIPDIIPERMKFRNNEVLQLDPKNNLILGDSSLRQTYDKLILACGLEADYTSIPGLLYSLDDKANPIFSIYEYERIIPKMTNYSLFLISAITPENDYKLSKKNDDFYRNGGGNIVFANCTEDIFEIFYSFELILILYEYINKNRSKEYLNSLNFILTIPINKEKFTSEEVTANIGQYFVKKCEERGIYLKWGYKLKNVGPDQTLIFENKNDKNEKKENYSFLEYNYSVVMPNMRLPSFIRYCTDICKDEKQIEYNSENLTINDFKNIYLIGDVMQSGNFLDRFYSNIFLQSYYLSNNLKKLHFRLEDHNKPRIYQPYQTVHFDYELKNYSLFNTLGDLTKLDDKNKIENSGITSIKKNIWSNLLFKHLYFRPEGYYCQKMLLEKKFGFKFPQKI